MDVPRSTNVCNGSNADIPTSHLIPQDELGIPTTNAALPVGHSTRGKPARAKRDSASSSRCGWGSGGRDCVRHLQLILTR
jgi:hypothetical protein